MCQWLVGRTKLTVICECMLTVDDHFPLLFAFPLRLPFQDKLVQNVPFGYRCDTSWLCTSGELSRHHHWAGLCV